MEDCIKPTAAADNARSRGAQGGGTSASAPLPTSLVLPLAAKRRPCPWQPNSGLTHSRACPIAGDEPKFYNQKL